MNQVTSAPASATDACAHFQTRLRFETDCADVHASLERDDPGFILLDVRSHSAFASGHIDGALNLPREQITEEGLSGYPADTIFVVCCAGPHCNGANKGALRIAQLGRPVKEMIGGIEGWKDEGFDLVNLTD